MVFYTPSYSAACSLGGMQICWDINETALTQIVNARCARKILCHCRSHGFGGEINYRHSQNQLNAIIMWRIFMIHVYTCLHILTEFLYIQNYLLLSVIEDQYNIECNSLKMVANRAVKNIRFFS
jgi:hypothetical protein